MPRNKDYYEILGVARGASNDEIRKSYLKLAHKYHPDKTGGDKAAEDKLKEINAAYDTLKNPEKRSQYDRFGEAGSQFGGGGGGFGFGQGGPSSDFGGFDSPFEDLFESLFGGSGRGQQRTSAPGKDLEYNMSISLHEAAFGTKKEIKFSRTELCGDCSGTGAAAGSKPVRCGQCGGSGQVRRTQGFFSISQTCPACRGTGQTIANPCRKCSGSGRAQTTRKLSIDIPAGVDTGLRIRYNGEGEPGIGNGPRGDLFIRIEVLDDDIFDRDGINIICQMPISIPQALLGDTIRVPTLKGEAQLKIPAGTQSGTVFRLRGLGLPDLRGYKQGDLRVEVQVEIPTKLTREQRELIKKFRELSDAKAYPLHQRFIEKLKGSLGG